MFSSDDPCAMATMFTPAAGDRRERARGDAGSAAHAEADDGDERDALLGVDAIDEMQLPLGLERSLERRNGVIGLGFRHDEADARLARGLADHRHRMSRLRERGERAAGDAGHADHAALPSIETSAWR